MKEILREAF